MLDKYGLNHLHYLSHGLLVWGSYVCLCHSRVLGLCSGCSPSCSLGSPLISFSLGRYTRGLHNCTYCMSFLCSLWLSFWSSSMQVVICSSSRCFYPKQLEVHLLQARVEGRAVQDSELKNWLPFSSLAWIWMELTRSVFLFYCFSVCLSVYDLFSSVCLSESNTCESHSVYLSF